MSKVVAMAHAPQTHIFDPLVPVTLPLPWEGQWEHIKAVYSFTAVMDLLDDWESIVAEMQPVMDAANAKTDAAKDGTPADRKAAREEQDRVNRDFSLRIIGRVVLRLEWPYQGNPPDPQDPASFARWPTPILQWLAGNGLTEVRKRVDDPLSRNGSTSS